MIAPQDPSLKKIPGTFQVFLMALVLCTGIDPDLLETRRLILERAGHRVVTATNEKAATDACNQQSFDLAVIGQMISPRVKLRVFALIREVCSSARILELYAPHMGRTLEEADYWLAVPTDDPQELADCVAALVADKTAGQPQS